MALAGILILAYGFTSVEFADQKNNNFPLHCNFISKFAHPFEHGFHEQILFVDGRPLNLLPYLLYSSFD